MANGCDIVKPGDHADLLEWHALARQVSTAHPEVERFAARAIAEIARVRKLLTFALHLVDGLEADAAIFEVRIARQSELLTEQAVQMASVLADLRQVSALCELAEWAAHTVHANPGGASILVDDLRHVLLGVNAS